MGGSNQLLTPSEWFSDKHDKQYEYDTRQDAYNHLFNSGDFSSDNAWLIVDTAYRRNNLPYGAGVVEGELEDAADSITASNGWHGGSLKGTASALPESTYESYGESGDNEMSELSDIFKMAEESYQKNLNELPANFGKISDAALAQKFSVDASLKAADRQSWAEAYGADYDTMINELVTPRRSLLADVTESASAFAKGEIPQDVQDEMTRSLAESGQSKGLFGQVADYSKARHLGMTSLAMKDKANQYISGTINPLVSSLMNTSRMLKAPTVDYGTMLNAASAQAGRPMSASERASMIQNQSQFDAEMAWAQELSAMNMAAEDRRWNLGMDAASAQAKSDQRNSLFNAGVDLLPFLKSWGDKAWSYTRDRYDQYRNPQNYATYSNDPAFNVGTTRYDPFDTSDPSYDFSVDYGGGYDYTPSSSTDSIWDY